MASPYGSGGGAAATGGGGSYWSGGGAAAADANAAANTNAAANASANASYNYYGRNPHLRPYEDFRGPFVLKTRTAAKIGTGEEVLFVFTKEHPLSRGCYTYFQEYLLFDREVVEADTGIYTWLIKHFNDGTQRLIAAPALSKQEVGTLHANLDGLTTDGTVLIAGELQIQNSNKGKYFTYNILSGTYTMRLTDSLRRDRLELLKEALKGLGVYDGNIILAGEGSSRGLGELLASANVKVPEYAATNYQTICEMQISAFAPHAKRKSKRGGARRSHRHKGDARRRHRTRRHSRR
jgi:hypothetical protein